GLRPEALSHTWPALLAGIALCALAGRAFSWSRARTLASVAFLIGVAACRPGPPELHAARSLHGVHRVVAQDGFHHHLSNGVVHGRQAEEPARRGAPRAYFALEAPLGQVVSSWSRAHPHGQAAVIGLGIGGILPHAAPQQRWRFWELDPVVIAIARDLALFSYLADAKARGVILEVFTGDGRLGLQHEPQTSRHDLLVVDAFSGNAIPIHLLTEEAFDLYVARLKDDGLLVLNISTRYLDLTPLVASAAERLGLVGLQRREASVSSDARRLEGRAPSHCVVLARDPKRLESLVALGWSPLPPPAARPWRDERASVVEVMSLLRSGR
ncbi:MAG: fused MFS/spermidine synthase, partial [Planctomycetes bacterium]|nr:fused MFS/spermidine synthase [Planctomycetota bacterium]